MTSYGVVVGRFQIDVLTAAHRRLLQTAAEENDGNIIVFIGVSPGLPGKHDPLDYVCRSACVDDCISAYDNAHILPIADHPSDAIWSEQLDAQIKAIVGTGNAVLYHGPESFAESYFGKYPTRNITDRPENDTVTEFDVELVDSGSSTVARQEIVDTHTEFTYNELYRRGIVYANASRPPISYQTIDVAILDELHPRILLARKPTQSKYRFVGGFVDVADMSLEETVDREVIEETGLILNSIKYLGSHRIEDYRYQNSEDKIMTSLFVGINGVGAPEPKDDIVELKWFDFTDLTATRVKDLIVYEHEFMFRMHLEKIQKYWNKRYESKQNQKYKK